MLSMHRNSLPCESAPAIFTADSCNPFSLDNGLPNENYHTPQEEAPPYEDVDHSFHRGQV